jgi:hypothetical protein
MATLHPLAVQGMAGFMGDLDIAFQIPTAHANEQHRRRAGASSGTHPAAVTTFGGQVHAVVGRIKQRTQFGDVRRPEVLHGIGGVVAQLRQCQHRRRIAGVGHRGIPDLRRIDAGRAAWRSSMSW